MSIKFLVSQVIFESLPISSSAHALWIGGAVPEVCARCADGVTVLVLCAYFFNDIRCMLQQWTFRWRTYVCWGLLGGVADGITVLIYTLLKMSSLQVPLWFGFACTSIALLSLYFVKQQKREAVVFFDAVTIACAQAFAFFPGVSRLALTYAVACWRGFSPSYAFRISCAVQAPLFLAAFLENLMAVHRDAAVVGMSWLTIGAMLAAGCVAYCMLWFVEWLMKTRRLWYVGLYTLLLSIYFYFFPTLGL